MAYVKGQPFKPQFSDPNSGRLMSAGTIEFYLAGSSTPTPYYTDSSGTVGGTSLELDAGGKPPTDIFFDTDVNYKLVVKDGSGSPIETLEPFTMRLEGARLGDYTSTIDTVASIRNTALQDHKAVRTLGYASTGDRGAALYYADTEDNLTSDDGFMCIISQDGIRFKLQYGAVINAAWAGAIPESDVGARFNLAAAAANSAKAILEIPAGEYTSSIALDWSAYADLSVEGAGWRSTIINFTQDVPGIQFGGNELKGVQVRGIGAGTATQDGIILTSVRRKYLERVHAQGFYNGINYETGNHSYFNMIACVLNGNHGFFMSNTGIDNNGSTFGEMDLRGNTGDGLHMEASGAQINRSQLHFGGLISSTLNGGRCAYITGRGHNLHIYDESNGSGVYLDADSEGNEIVIQFGGQGVDDGSNNNLIQARTGSVEAWVHSNLQFKKAELNNRDFQGRLVTSVTADRSFQTEFIGSSSNAVWNFLHGSGGALNVDFDGSVGVKTYTVAALPLANTAGRFIYVSDESGGPVIAFCDGTDWRRVTDRAIVS